MNNWLLQAAAIAPERAALVTSEGELTYAALAERSMRIAGALTAAGVRRDQPVAIAVPSGGYYVAVVHGVLLAGAVAVPVDLRLSDEERARRIPSGAFVIDRPLTEASGASPAAIELDRTAAIMHTSGTTSDPRPVPLTYANWLANALGSAVALGLDRDERWLCPMPLVHVGGLSILLRSAIYATTVVLHGRFDTDAVLEALMSVEQRITLVSLVPTMLSRLLDAGLHEPPTLRWALLGGGPIAPALLERAHEAGVPVAPTYGMTEACSQIATHGWPLPGVELRLAPDAEILVRGAVVSPVALASDGWLHTGDLGAFDDRGRLAIIGRKADTIVSGGENVAPAEVEAVLLEHPAVADAAVHARPDPEWGEAVIATVVLANGASVDAAELQAFTAARIATYKVPKAIGFADTLPRTVSGKLLRRELQPLD